MPNNKRPIDDLVRESYDWWSKSFVFIKKTKIKTLYSVFILAFFTGAAIAIMWSISSDVHQSSLAASDEKQSKQCNEFLKNAKKFEDLSNKYCKQAEKNKKYVKTCENYKAQAKKYKDQYNSRCLKRECEDSDGGINYNKQGEIKFWPPIIGGVTTQKDFCVIEESAPKDNYEFCSGEKCKLHEFSCKNKNTADERVRCEYGCLRGACVNEIIINERTGKIEDNYVSMQWETNIESDCMIAFGSSPDLSNSTSTLGLVARPFPDGKYSPFVYTADINGLNGGTTYYFKIMCSKGALKAETEISSITTACSSVTIGNSKYRLEPCQIKAEMVDGQGNKDFSFNIIQEGERRSYGFGVYGYGVGFPTYAILGGSSSGGAIGNVKIDKYFSDKILSANGPENGLYKGYLPIKVYHGSATGWNQYELRLNLDLTVKIAPISMACTDSDGYENYNMKGTAKGRDAYGGDINRIAEYTDKCDGSGRLMEFYCSFQSPGSEGYVTMSNIPCPNGCKDGACIQNPVPTAKCGDNVCSTGETASVCPQDCCSGSMEPNIWEKGSIVYYNYFYKNKMASGDLCQDANPTYGPNLQEVWCCNPDDPYYNGTTGNYCIRHYKYSEYCPKGCINGACVK